MRQVDVVLSLLTLVAVVMGYSAYRAWHPDSDPVAQPAIKPAAGNRPGEQLSDAERAALQAFADDAADRLVDANTHLKLQPGAEGGVKCWKGVVYRQTGGRWEPVEGPSHYLAGCEIRIEPVRPDSSQASEQTP